jgi:hypothetical protein
MKQTFSTSQVAAALNEDPYGGWSWAGAMAMAEYLEEYEASIGEELELDIVAIRCGFSEYPSLIDWAEEYFSNYTEEFGIDYTDSEGNERIQSVTDEDGGYHGEVLDAIRDYITGHTILVEFDGGIIVGEF